jgi:hypothetical protein
MKKNKEGFVYNEIKSKKAKLNPINQSEFYWFIATAD